MKIFFVVLFAFLYTAQGVPSQQAVHDSPPYSMKNDLSEESFIEQIPDDSFGSYGEFGVEPKIEAVGYDHEHSYEDFSTDVGRYPEIEQFRSFEGFQDVIPREVRVSGLSVDAQDKSHADYSENSGTTEDKQSTSQNTHLSERDSEDLSASAGLGDALEMAGKIEDVTVEGLSEYSYLVGDKLHGLNEMKVAGAMNSPDKVMLGTKDSGQYEDFNFDEERDEDLDDDEKEDEEFDHDVGRDEDFDYDEEREGDLNYDEFLEGEDREIEDDEHDHDYDHADELTVKGQAIDDEEDEGLDEEYFDEDDEMDDSERFEDGDFEDDGDYYDEDEDEDEDEDDEINTGVRNLDADEEDEYDDEDDDFDEDDDENFAVRYEEENETAAHVKGMSVGFQEDEDEEDEEDYDYDEEMPETGRQDDEDDYEDDYVRELDEDEEEDWDVDEDWDDDEDEVDSSTRDVDELDEDTSFEDEASESLHGDEVKPDVKAEKLP